MNRVSSTFETDKGGERYGDTKQYATVVVIYIQC